VTDIENLQVLAETKIETVFDTLQLILGFRFLLFLILVTRIRNLAQHLATNILFSARTKDIIIYQLEQEQIKDIKTLQLALDAH